MNKDIRFGVVQGRLTQSPPNCLQWFPQESWEDEFKIASELGIDYIELIAETNHNPNNPIWSSDGIKKIRDLVVNNDLTLHALCNDFIIENSILSDEGINQNINLISQGKALGVEKYVLPLFESSELNSKNMKDFIDNIKVIAKIANQSNMQTCLETILKGDELTEFLELVDLPFVKVVYDTGNRVACGHDLPNDIRLLGSHIAHVHIKDKNKNNNNTLLGTGLVDFENVFYALTDIGYDGPFTFETVRGNNPISTAIYNMHLVEFFLGNAKLNV